MGEELRKTKQMPVRQGLFQNLPDFDLARLFPRSAVDSDFSWSDFQNGWEVVEAAQEIEFRQKDVASPKPWWVAAVAMSREFRPGYEEYRISLIENIGRLNKLSYQADAQKQLSGVSLKRLKELFNIK